LIVFFVSLCLSSEKGIAVGQIVPSGRDASALFRSRPRSNMVSQMSVFLGSRHYGLHLFGGVFGLNWQMGDMFPIRLWNFDALRTTATVSQHKVNDLVI
jgi:hypothetical protein